MKKIMYVGGSWGDAIYFLNPDDEVKTRIYGFKHRYYNGFAEGSVLFDLAYNQNEKTIPLYLIHGIEYKDDPHDMFFANIKLIGNVRNPRPAKGEYGVDWFKEPCRELLEEYLSRSWWWRYKHKTFINTLTEMLES